MALAVLFPGQGSQFRGMGADLFDRRPDLLGAAADEILGWSLRQMCLEAEDEELTRTEYAQPALYAVSYALWDELAKEMPVMPTAAAGHSLGEYTALAAAGALDFEQGLAVVAERGRAMAGAADQEASGMAAVIGADLEATESVALTRRQMGGRLFVANINAPGQVVVSGGAEDIDWLESEMANLGIKRVIRLKVTGAFHSPFMGAAADRLAAALAGVEIGQGRFQVWSNVTAEPHHSELIKDQLVRQVVSPVRFADTLQALAATGVDTFAHVGPGDVTAGLAKRSAPGLRYLTVSNSDGIPPLVEALGTID
ncbi:MAG: ACP S-malonyltransferase [Acidimicrobiia bacterium]